MNLNFSVNELIQELEKPENKDSGMAQQSILGSKSFTGTENFQENLNYFYQGFPCTTNFQTEYLEKNLQVLKPVNTFFMSNESIYNLYDIGEYCSGNPEFFVQCMPVETELKIVNIYFSSSFHCEIKTDTIKRYGEIVYFTVKFLLDRGFKVNLFSYIRLLDSYKNEHDFTVKIKDSEYDIDLDRVKYFLLCPSFLRRTIFKVIENRTELHKKLGSSYGLVNKEKPDFQGIVFPTITENNFDYMKILIDAIKEFL